MYSAGSGHSGVRDHKPLNVTQACHHRQIGHHAGSPSNIMLSSCLQCGWLQIHAIPILFCRHSQEKDNLLSQEAHHAAAVPQSVLQVRLPAWISVIFPSKVPFCLRLQFQFCIDTCCLLQAVPHANIV